MGCTRTRLARLPESISRTSPNWGGVAGCLRLVAGYCRQLKAKCNYGLRRQILTLFVLVMSTTLPAWAQRVVLVPPIANDAILNDAFNRLQAELNIHRFDVQVVDAPLGPDPTEALTRIAQETDALASIALLHRAEQTSVQIWLVDRVSGKATMRALQVEPGGDAANLLAIRAVDLLRASLSEFTADEKPPSDVVNVDRRAVPVVVQKLTERPPPKFALRADAVVLYEWPRLGFGVGPALGGAYRLGEAFDLGLTAAGPIVGTKFNTPEGSITIRQELGWAEFRLHLMRSTRVTAGVGLIAGALILSAQGQPGPSLDGHSAHVWGFLGGLDLHSQLHLAPRVAVEFALRAMGTAPKLGVALYNEQTVMSLHILAGSIGLRVAL